MAKGYNPYGPGNDLGPPAGGPIQQAQADTEVAQDDGGVPQASDMSMSRSATTRGKVTGRARAKVAAFRNRMRKGG
jgi:hypothetical protein